MRLEAFVEEKEDAVFVTTISVNEAYRLGDDGVEKLVREWCAKQNPPLTFIDYAC